MDENTRLSDLTRMLLSSPSFSGFLDTLASNPAAAQTAQAVQQPQQQQPQVEQPQRQIRKDVNPYAAQSQMQQQQQIGMAMIPEQTMDFSMLDLASDGFPAYQPQVFSVLSVPEAVIDTEVLSGKSSVFSPISSDEKIELPKVERMPIAKVEEVETPVIVDEEFDADPAFALFAPSIPIAKSSPTTLDLSFLVNLSIKPPTYELIVIDDSTSDLAMRRVERLSAEVDACVDRLMGLTMHL